MQDASFHKDLMKLIRNNFPSFFTKLSHQKFEAIVYWIRSIFFLSFNRLETLNRTGFGALKFKFLLYV